MRPSDPLPIRPLLVLAALTLAAAGCREEAPAVSPSPAKASATTPEPTEPATEGPVILFVGDSLTAGYGVGEDEAWTWRVGQALKRRGSRWTVRNAGVSGDTSAGVVRRMDWLLADDVEVVFLSIGANDGLRGMPLAETKRNLDAIADQVAAKGKTLVVAGMKLPPNYGPEYTQGFEALFADLAKARGSKHLPFLLEGVGGHADKNLPDGIHPNPAGHEVIAKHVLAFLDRERILGE